MTFFFLFFGLVWSGVVRGLGGGVERWFWDGLVDYFFFWVRGGEQGIIPGVIINSYFSNGDA